MRLADASLKRVLLHRLNEVIQRSMTANAPDGLSFSLAYVQLANYIDRLPDLFLRDAGDLGVKLPLFIVPKVPNPAEIESRPESTRRRHKSRPAKPPPTSSSRKGGRAKEDEAARAALEAPEPKELTPELRAAVRQTIRTELKQRILAFESLAGESSAVGRQLTRGNDIDRLDTNLDAEIEDDL
jgi:hypothetical protein